jgi:hypothetical protein
MDMQAREEEEEEGEEEDPVECKGANAGRGHAMTPIPWKTTGRRVVTTANDKRRVQ